MTKLISAGGRRNGAKRGERREQRKEDGEVGSRGEEDSQPPSPFGGKARPNELWASVDNIWKLFIVERRFSVKRWRHTSRLKGQGL